MGSSGRGRGDRNKVTILWIVVQPIPQRLESLRNTLHHDYIIKNPYVNTPFVIDYSLVCVAIDMSLCSCVLLWKRERSSAYPFLLRFVGVADGECEMCVEVVRTQLQAAMEGSNGRLFLLVVCLRRTEVLPSLCVVCVCVCVCGYFLDIVTYLNALRVSLYLIK